MLSLSNMLRQILPVLCFTLLFLPLGHCIQRRRPFTSILSINQSTWDAFNASISGHLFNGEPIMASCYTHYNGKLQVPDAEQCAILQRSRSDPVFVSDYFGGYMNVREYPAFFDPFHYHPGRGSLIHKLG